MYDHSSSNMNMLESSDTDKLANDLNVMHISKQTTEGREQCTYTCERLRKKLHSLVDASCDTLIRRSTICNAIQHTCTNNTTLGCIHDGIPHVRIDRKILQITQWGIHSIATVTYGYCILDIPDPLIEQIAKYVESDERRYPKTRTYMKNANGDIVPVKMTKCQKPKGAHKHIPTHVLNMYSSCYAFKRVLENMYLR